MRRTRSSGALSVTGPNESGSAANMGMALSLGSTFATRHRREEGELTYYVRNVAGEVVGRVTKREDGVIEVLGDVVRSGSAA